LDISKKNKLKQNSQYTISSHPTWRSSPYSRSHEFTADELDEITFDDVLHYFHMRCFGAVNPNFADQALIVVHQVNTVEFWKKSLSWFFVNADVENKTQCWQMILFIIW
jgi:hypothetical protein